MLKNSEQRYGAIAQLFHWVIVGLIVTQFVLALRAESLPRGMKLINTLAMHKSIGMTVFALAILRILWRWMNPVPAEPLNAVLAWTLFALVLLHIAAALKHHFIDKDNVLRRMLPLKLKMDQRL